jgi:hypothetical protein
MRVRRWGIWAVALVVLTAPGAAWAVATLTFLGGPGGTLSYGGLDLVDPLLGADVAISTVVGSGTPANPGVTLFCSPACDLDFATGANTAEGAVYTWAAGGSFTLSGDLWTGPGGTGTHVTLGGSETLVSGTWTSPIVGVAGGGISVTGFGSDTKSPTLLAYYGITNTAFEFFNNEIAAAFAPGSPTGTGAFSASVTTATIVNTAAEPGQLFLLGVGLAGVGILARRRLKVRDGTGS